MSACTCPRNAPPGPPSPPEWHCHGCGYWNPSLGRDDRRTTTCRTCGAARPNGEQGTSDSAAGPSESGRYE